MRRITKAEGARLLRYGAAGLSTTLLNLLLFRLLSGLMPGYRSANAIAIVLTKLYGYLVNKLFVFRSRGLSPARQVREVAAYAAARGFTGLVDYFGLIALVSAAGVAPFPAKVTVQGLVIVLNYVLGKRVVFRRPEEEKPPS